MPKKIWVFDPRTASPKISVHEKTKIKQKCDRLIDAKFKPGKIKPFNPNNKKKCQLIGIYSKWRQNNILFIARYKDLRPNAIALEYEDKIARIGYFGENQCYLYYMRHTGKWCDITYQAGDSLNECLQGIKELPYFYC